MISVRVDPTIKCGVNGQLTFVPYFDIDGDEVPEVGTTVAVTSGLDGSTSTGVVVAVNEVAMLIYVAVAWEEFQKSEVEVW